MHGRPGYTQAGSLCASLRHVFAYLADEVFERQPAHLKTFLMQTALLDCMCGPLCDAVLGVGDWGSEELERANLFVSALDFLGSLVAGVLLGDLATNTANCMPQPNTIKPPSARLESAARASAGRPPSG